MAEAPRQGAQGRAKRARIPTSTGGGSPISSTSAGRWTSSRRSGSSPSARSSTSSARAATTWRRSCSAAGSTIRRDARLRLLPLAAAAARARRAARRRARLGHGPGRAAIRTAAISASSSTIPIPTAARRCRCAAASARNIRRPPAGRRRSNIIATCSDDDAYDGAIAVVLGGDASLRDQRLLVGADHRHHPEAADALLRRGQSIRHLGPVQLPDAGRRHRRRIWRASPISHIFSGDGTEPAEAARLIDRGGRPCPRRRGAGLAAPHRAAAAGPQLPGHPDLQERGFRPRPNGRAIRCPSSRPISSARCSSEAEWDAIDARGRGGGRGGARRGRGARRRRSGDASLDHVFYEGEMQQRGGQWTQGYRAPRIDRDAASPRASGSTWSPRSAARSTTSSRSTRACSCSARISGPRAASTRSRSACRTSSASSGCSTPAFSEEGIIGRAVGMALAGLMPVPEIQFRKYAEPALEQINDCGTMRWRTNNRFAAPMVLRMPVGFFKCGDPWHSQTNEVQFVHNPGWLVAAPSNAEDAVGLLRSALARQRSDRLLRASRDARRRLGAAALSGRRLCPALRPGEEDARRATRSPSSPGARWCRAARKRRRTFRPT